MLGRDGVAGLIFLGLSVVLLFMTRGLPQSALVPIGPDFYPRIVLGIMAALSAALVAIDVIASRRRRAGPVPAAPARNYGLVALTFIVFGLYVVVLPFLGFRLATFSFVAALQAVLEPPRSMRRWVAIVVVAAACALITHLVFESYLHVLLPRGTWTGI